MEHQPIGESVQPPLSEQVSESGPILGQERAGSRMVPALITLSLLSAIGLVAASSMLIRRMGALSKQIADNPSMKPLAGQQLPALKQIGSFKLTERSGKEITEKSLAGKVSLWAFTFTTCPGLCRTVTGVMARLRAELPADRVQCVNLSVDPINDTPAKLTEFANDFQAPPDSWWFLTGSRDQIYAIIRNQFGLVVEENPNPAEGEEPITHSPKIAVVDQSGKIVGLYSSSDAAQIDQLKRRVEQMLK